jgi:hypothetical protein
MAMGRKRRGSPREMSTVRSGTLEFNGGAVLAILGGDEVHDDVPRR